MDFSNYTNKSDFLQNMNQYKRSQSVTTTVTALKNLSSIVEYSVCPPLESQPDVATNLVLGCEGKLSGMNKESIENESVCRWLNESVVDFSGLTFPQKMHHVLKNKEIGDIVTWLPSGKSFVIGSPKAFISEVVPKYFGKNIAYTSFTRRLGRWGLQNIARATYFNPNFCRDHPEKCLLMTYSLSTDNKQGNLRPLKGFKSLKRDKLIKEPSSSIPNINSRHLASNAASEKASFKTSSIQDPLPDLQQFAYPPNLQCCAPLLSFQYSSADSVGQQGFAGGKVGIVKPPFRSSFQQANLVGLPQPMLVGNHAEAVYRSQMEYFLRRRLVVQAASQANVLSETYKLAIALSALEEASKSFGEKRRLRGA
jgi:hypothetical protein